MEESSRKFQFGMVEDILRECEADGTGQKDGNGRRHIADQRYPCLPATL